ncbi:MULTISPECIES: hypothetical protein [Paenibacillus]|uniref:hypothetical protein n=1 Tax=Paenibacillus TaxID=44249 RepID=UPI0022B89CB2|nr:hypothetical protein [Paenibacillus caseinilyticus]MCZ8521804.1 hypothetical protein [Paenibacillus caseinilyticus]
MNGNKQALAVPADEWESIQVEVTSANFWWGIYGLTPLWEWEDIRIYRKRDDEREQIAYFCICCKSYLRAGIEELAQDSSEEEYVQEIEAFLDDDAIRYHYYYSRADDVDREELPYANLPLNLSGRKPRSIELWHPAEGVDEQVIKQAAAEFCGRFLGIEAAPVELMATLAWEDALACYTECARFSGEIVFEESVVESMAARMARPEEEVRQMLERSIGF